MREETGLLGDLSRAGRSIERAGEGWRAEVEAGGTVYDVDVRREEGEATHLTCSTATLKRPSHYVAGSLRARAS